MIEIRYRNHCEIVNMAGQSISDVREQFKVKFGISNKAIAKLNDKKVMKEYESKTILNDDDGLSFEKVRGKGIILITALLIGLTLCGGLFAYGYNTNTVTLSVDLPGSGTDFVDVTINNTSPLSWNLSASVYGSTGNGTLFDLDTVSANYTGDIIATVYFTNGYKLIDVYRILNMYIAVYNSAGNLVDINDDESANVTNDRALLTLTNGSVDLFITQTNADIYTVKVVEGYFLADSSWTSGYESPNLYCEVAQR